MKKIIVVISILMLITSCSNNKLTNEVASEVIKNGYPTFCTGRIYTKTTFWANPFSQESVNESKKDLKLYRELESQDLVNVIEEKDGIMSNPDIIYSITLTDKAKKMYNGEFALTSNEFNGVIGISQNENQAIVKYKMKSVKTPFYPLHYKLNNEYTCYETEWEEEVTLVRFDTSWKIKNE